MLIETFGDIQFCFSSSNLSVRGVPKFGLNRPSVTVGELHELSQLKMVRFLPVTATQYNNILCVVGD